MGGETSSEESEDDLDAVESDINSLNVGVLSEKSAQSDKEQRHTHHTDGSITGSGHSFWDEDSFSWMRETWTAFREAWEDFFKDEEDNVIEEETFAQHEDPALLLAYMGAPL
jgi:hypothetical protein